MEILCSICCCNLIDLKQEVLPFSSSENNSSEVYSSLCGHIFHKTCILTWIERSKNCPDCRAAIQNKDDFHKVFFNVNLKSDEDADEAETKKRTDRMAKCVKKLARELGQFELKFDQLKDEIADKDHEINTLRSMLNQERLSVPLRRVTLK